VTLIATFYVAKKAACGINHCFPAREDSRQGCIKYKDRSMFAIGFYQEDLGQIKLDSKAILFNPEASDIPQTILTNI